MEELFYEISQMLMTPVLLVIYAAFAYSLFEMGRFLTMAVIRRRNRGEFARWHEADDLGGYPIASFCRQNPDASLNDIEIHALGKLEFVRVVTRVTPMLGLIATLIPMGPALMALAENDVTSLSQLLRTAFTAVILALVAASITFWVASVRKRWYAEEITAAEKRVVAGGAK